MAVINPNPLTQDDVNNLLKSYTQLLGRFEFSSVLRERNNALLSKTTDSTIIRSVVPYVPFIILIGPNQIQRTGWNPITQVAQTIDGAVLNVTPNAEFPTLRISGTSGDLTLITDTPSTPIYIDNAAVASLVSGISTVTNLSNGITNDDKTIAVLKNFYSVLAQISTLSNLKRQSLLLLKSWVEEPNIVNDSNQVFHNFKYIRIFSTLYPPPNGKAYWGIADGYSDTMTAEAYRKADWEFNFKIIKEVRPDFDSSLFPGVANTGGNNGGNSTAAVNPKPSAAVTSTDSAVTAIGGDKPTQNIKNQTAIQSSNADIVEPLFN